MNLTSSQTLSILTLTAVVLLSLCDTGSSIVPCGFPGAGCTVNEDFFCCYSQTTQMVCDPFEVKCVCPAVTTSYFDYVEKICYIHADGDCDPTMKIECGPNSNCSSSSATCQCFPGFEPMTPNKKCAHQYGSPCSEEDECDHDEFLTCRDSQCQCSVSATLDLATGKCVTKAGQSCDRDTPMYPPCPRNATCDPVLGGKTLCQCDPPFGANAEGQCRLPFDHLCTATEECDEKKYLSCKTGVCQCDRRSEYDQVTEKCNILAGQDCTDSLGQSCVKNASCQLAGPGSYCVYDPTFSFSQGHCVRRHGQECDEADAPCDQQLFHECVNQECKCHRPDDSWYNPTTQNCSLLAGVSCEVNDLDPFPLMTCVKNSHCEPRSWVCTCDENLLPNKERFCVLPHGHLCDPVEDNCDPAEFLVCDATTMRCACANPTITFWDTRVGACKVRAGQNCNSMGFPDCALDALCIFDNSGLWCKCTGEDLVPNSFGKCVLPYGSPCTAGPFDQCNDEGHQRCQEKICQCTDPTHMAHDPMDGNCKLTWDSPCHPQGVPCLGNLTCGPENVCRCDESLGLVDKGDGKCVGGWGSKCENEDECSVAHFLTCFDATCVCLPSFSAVTSDDNVTTKCVGNQGVTCVTNYDCHMEASLTCNSGSCGCSIVDEQAYDPIDKKCYGNLFARCDLTPPSLPDQIPLFCHPTYVCKEAAGNDTGDFNVGRCYCSSNGRCPADWVTPGGQLWTCSLAVGLILLWMA